MLNEQEYMKKWIALNQKMAEEHFTWGTAELEDDYEQYMSFHLYKMGRKQWNDIQEATKKIGHIVNKAYHEIFSSETLKSRLGIPAEAWDTLSILSRYFSYFSRLDLVVNHGDIKLIEVNSDTPTGYLETSTANRIICEDQGYSSPNHLESAIFKAWRKIEYEYQITSQDTVYFTSYGWHDEDRETVLFNMRNSGLARTRYIPLEEIIVSETGIYDGDGERIDYLYRLYPLEYLPDDKDPNGKNIGNLLLDHIANGRVKIINPPSAFMMQSKAVMGIIWELASQEGIFTEAEKNDIQQYFLPTFFSNEPFRGLNLPYVEKPIFGREGGGVVIFDRMRKVVDEDPEHWYSEWPKIYQEYKEMPDYTLDTWTGPYTGKLLVGSFLIGGEPSGLFLRVGEKITGNLSMFCGITVTED
ncbi:glutathionylspermidine synthase family protein [Heyndrickxia acidicola]|uniref:Glutathionylspermidine synthase family protein n=2 Tax=Heyndrickxia acidicola TaxID=209389 RepID=A0ABU6MGJ7_9BACI|nr:glutathionylspermidine synthase family protein [Heyndrickxia acidicola]MED1203414.1 glutathionylspermidine synthase family protein [Heyndrickxia acidicola]